MTPPNEPHPLQYQSPPPPGPGLSGVVCPRCGDYRSKPVGFTWWGGMIGPRILHHVKCLGCGTGYNGKSGRLNTTGIIIYTVVILVIVLLVVLLRTVA